MERREATFTLRCTLVAEIPDAMWADEDFEENAWLDEWEAGIKPGLIRAVFTHVRGFPGWEAHTRNRGYSTGDEIEIVMTRRFAGASGRGD